MRILISLLLLIVPTLYVWADDSAVEKIGILLCLSGDCAQWGQGSLNGALLAVEELNTEGGINGRKVVARVEDSREAKPSETITGFRALAADSSIRLVVGPTWTPAGMALAPVVARTKGLLVVTPSITVTEFSAASKNLFNMMPPEDLMTKALARFALRHGWTRMAVFASQHPAEFAQGKVFRLEFENLGGIVSFFADPLPDATDLETEALRIVKSKPDAVFISNWWGVAPRALRTAGFTGPVLTRQMDQQRLEAAGEFLTRAYFPRYPKPTTVFQAKYFDKFKEAPPLYAATAYDIVRLYAHVREKTRTTDPARLQAAFAAATFQGASGLIQFGRDRTVLTRSVEIAQIIGKDLDGPAVE